MKNLVWNKTADKPLIDWNENRTEWVQSNYCPGGAFLAGYFENDGTFSWFKVMLTEKGLVELADENEFPFSDYGIEIDTFEFWLSIPHPGKEGLFMKNPPPTPRQLPRTRVEGEVPKMNIETRDNVLVNQSERQYAESSNEPVKSQK